MSRKIFWTLLIILALIAPFIGAVNLHIDQILDPDSLSAQIFYEIRLPRVIYTFFAGSLLAITGLIFQTLFRNALMTPYTLGISSGATLGAGIAIKLGLGSFVFGIATITLFGFAGALFTIFLLLYLSQFLKSSQEVSLLLLGIALSLFYSSALMVVFYLGNSIQNDMLIRFTMGSLAVIGWQNPLLLSAIALVTIVMLYLYRFELQLLGLSKESAQTKGLNAKKTTLILLILSSFGIAVLVSISGPIGFVGLVAPHMVAKMYNCSIEKRVLKTFFFGGFFLLLCDTLSRALPTQSELPIGIITALIGGPFFIYLIIKGK